MNSIEKRILEDVRHWFHNAEIDLYLWFHQHKIKEIQLTYDKSNQEKMIHWKQLDNGEKLSHCEVDDGEDDPSANLSPMVKDICHPIDAKLKKMLSELNWEMEPEHLKFFLEKISSVPSL